MQELIAMIKWTAQESRRPREAIADAREPVDVSPLKSDSPLTSVRIELLSPASAMTETLHEPKSPPTTLLSCDGHLNQSSNQAAFLTCLSSSSASSNDINVACNSPALTDMTLHPVTTSVDDITDLQTSVDVAACGYPTNPDPTTIKNGPATSMMAILLPQSVDVNTDFEPLPPRVVQQSAIVPVQTRGRKKGKTPSPCTKVPPEPILSREEGWDPISIVKLV
ncbi:hypothetical protein M758_UG207000 [Ceratodon purpureus]|nr:hypothetical protein M758_UG207000 [Ceratodon purpureus]